jgi:hypothetical protein
VDGQLRKGMGVDSKIGCGAGNGLLMVEELQDGDASVLGCQRNQAIGIMTGFLCVRHLKATFKASRSSLDGSRANPPLSNRR